MSQVHKPFTPEEDAHLLYLRKLGKTIGQMGAALNRRDTTCWNRLRILMGVHKKPAPVAPGIDHDRRCLVCHQWFRPEHEQQYIMDKCVVTDYTGFEIEAAVMGPAVGVRLAE